MKELRQVVVNGTSYEGYFVDEEGNVYSDWKCGGFPVCDERYRHVLNPRESVHGYLEVNLFKDRKSKMVKVHRLVAEAFIPNPDDLPQVNHKDEVKTNNRIENLEWCDAYYNANYGTGKWRAGQSRSVAILQYTMSGDFVQEWLGSRTIERATGIGHRDIIRCCKGARGCKSAGGFIWRYKG